MLQSNEAVEIQASHPEQTSTQSRTRRTLAGLLAATGLLATPLAHAVFVTPGQLDVSPTGAASYTVPIAVPPGTAGMAPSLSLAYNSQGGNGLLGMGWSLSGLSAVTRCPKTLAQDNTRGGINYTAADKYCLDGQRLVGIAGTYGADGTEYRTEREGFSKVVSYGSNGYGPTWFKVWTKSGQIMEFGNTADSAIEAQGKSAIRVWAVNKITDTKGNYLTIAYTEDNPNGQYYPSRVDYTGNAAAGLATYNSVRFVYAARPDIIPAVYVSGSLISTTQRLTNVQTWANVSGADTLVKDYRLAYDNTGANGYSLLSSLTECAGDATCLPATALAWAKSQTVQPFAAVASWGAGTYCGTSTSVRRLGTGDFNGDGRADLLYGSAGTGNNVCVQYSNGNGFGAPVAVGYDATGGQLGTSGNYYYPRAFAGDVNGDGLADIVLGAGGVMLSTGGGFAAVASWGAGTYCGTSTSVRRLGTGDFNGDGRADLLYGSAGTGNNVCVQYSNGNGFGAPVAVGYDATGGQLGTSGNYYYPRAFAGDVNGDGLADIVLGAGGVMLSTGGGFAAVASWGAGTYCGTSTSVRRLEAGDFNGDGRADLLYGSAGTGNNVCVQYSNGNGFGAPVAVGYDATGGQLGTSGNYYYPIALAGDVNGDGLADVVLGAGGVVLAQTPVPDLATSIQNGLNAATTVTYRPLSDASVYVPETGGVYPVRDVNTQTLLYIVSSVSSSDGIGGNYVSNYTYAGAKSHLTGGGFLGFRQTVGTDTQTGIKSTTTYRQDYPYQGLPSSAEKRTSSGVLLNSVSNTWSFDTNPSWSAQYHAPKLTQSIESSYELTGALISTVTTGNTYDTYGNPTGITVSTPDGYSKTTTNTYINDVVNWYLGRLTNATVTSTTP